MYTFYLYIIKRLRPSAQFSARGRKPGGRNQAETSTLTVYIYVYVYKNPTFTKRISKRIRKVYGKPGH